MTPREWARLQGFPDKYVIPVADASVPGNCSNSPDFLQKQQAFICPLDVRVVLHGLQLGTQCISALTKNKRENNNQMFSARQSSLFMWRLISSYQQMT